MRNKLFIFSIIFSIGATVAGSVSCSLSSVKEKKARSSTELLNTIEGVNWEITAEALISNLGEPSDQALDEKSSTRVIRYLESGDTRVRSRMHFVFEGHPFVLTKKYINVYDKDLESDLSYWRNRVAASDIQVRTATVCNGHSIETFQYAIVSKFQRLEIEHGKVVRIFWQKEPLDSPEANNCYNQVK